MSAKKDSPVTGDVALQNGGSVTYASEVIAIIAGVAANEVEGVTGMCPAGGINEKIGKNRNITRGVKVELGTEEVSVELFMVIEYGKPIQKVAGEVQENVRKAVESMTGLHVVKVDVHIQGISFEKDKKANLTAGEQIPSLREAPEKEEKKEEKKTEEKPAAQERPEEKPEEPAVNAPETADETSEEAAEEPAAEETNAETAEEQ